MKKALPALLIAILLLGGVCVLLYPSISSWVNGLNQSRAIQQYADAVQQMDASGMEEQWERARAYNESFSGAYRSASRESLGAREALDTYQSVLNIGSVMGHIEIPAIGVRLPIYHGVGESSLQRGVGHIPQTHIPIGGAGSHSVLTSHRAMATSDLFNDLDQLGEGDVFHLFILDEILAYEVDQILVVLPEETGALLPTPGEDHVTLVTCTPYAVNSHRLLVRGARVPYVPGRAGETPDTTTTAGTNGSLVVLVLFFVLWVILGLVFWRRPKSGSKPNDEFGFQRRRDEKGSLVLVILLIVVGLGILFYPTLSRHLYELEAGRAIEDFEQTRTETQGEADPLLKQIRRYNRELFERGQENMLRDPFAFEQPNVELTELGYIEEVFGYLIVEKMGIRLPVYLGASQKNMNLGAAHLTHTSIPVGGENTHTVIIGHRNLVRAEMFREIQLLKPGDAVLFVNRWEEMEYIVTGTQVISPEETEYLLIQPRLDLLTLVTCHPRGQSTNRYLVYCERSAPGNQ